MDYYNFTYFFVDSSLFLILIVILSTYALLVVMLAEKVIKKSSDLFQYKITNKPVSILVASSYIAIFLILLYALRIYRINAVIDLHDLVNSLEVVYIFLMTLPVFITVGLSLFSLLTLIAVLLLLSMIHGFFIGHIFKIYIYYVYNKSYSLRVGNPKHPINILRNIGPHDIVSYIFVEFIIEPFIKVFYGKDRKYASFPRYHPYKLLCKTYSHKYFAVFVTLSPFLFILNDIISNAWILKSTYYYLLLYVPVIILRRVSTFIMFTDEDIANVLWIIYYKDDKGIYATSKDFYPVLQLFLLNGVRFDIDISLNLDGWYISRMLHFDLEDKDKNVFTNGEGVYLHKTPDNRVFQIPPDEEGNIDFNISQKKLGEEWVLLVDKTKND